MVEKSAREFILGFIAGEGSFQIDLQIDRDRVRYNVRAIPRLSILVHEEKVLDEIQKYIGGSRTTYGKQARLDIRSAEDCDNFIQLVDSSDCSLFFDTKKFEQYQHWKKAVELKSGKYGKKDVKEMVRLSFDAGMPEKRKRSEEDYLNIIDESGDYKCGGKNKDGSTCKRHVARPNNTCQHH